MRSLFSRSDVDKSDLTNYPSARIKDNDGSNNGTAVNEATKGDFHQMLEKLMRLYDIVPNGLPDNELNGFQLIEALSALASKNDYIYPLTTNGTDTLSIEIKLHLMKDNEFLVCLASTNKTTETLIKGSGSATFAVIYSGDFKANEYVRVIKTGAGVSIIRVADWNSLGAMATELLFLKKASQSQENAGSIDTVATTPLVNKITFTRRVNGADSDTYLASALQNGLMSITQFNQLASLTNNVINTGWFSGFDVGGSVGALPVSGGGITAATSTSVSPDSFVTVTMGTEMAGTNYLVEVYLQGQSASLNTDNDICTPVFTPISTTQFQLGFKEVSNNVQSLKVHLKVVQL